MDNKPSLLISFLLALSFFLPSSSWNLHESGNVALQSIDVMGDTKIAMEDQDESSINEHKFLEISNDYPGSGANDRHTPKAPGRANGHDELPTCWCPPATEVFKLNFDGSFENQFLGGRILCIIRDSREGLVDILASRVEVTSIIEVELMALKKGLLLAKQCGIMSLIVESDSIILVQNILATGRLVGDLFCLWAEVVAELLSFPWWKIIICKSEANQIAERTRAQTLSIQEVNNKNPLVTSATQAIDNVFCKMLQRGSLFPNGK